MVPYLTHPQTNSSLDQLNLSRTVLLKNLSQDLSLNDLLSEIDHGPIEYCKMFSTLPPQHIKDVDQVKTCYISFVNTHVSVSFYQKYAKNSYNSKMLKERLKGSKHLKISLNETCSSSLSYNSAGPVGGNNLCKQDFIKLKTLNYILEYNATRCILIKFEVSSPEKFDSVQEEFRARCSKMGDIEDFKSSPDEKKHVIKILVHFTSIDAAIKTYEFYSKRILLDLRTLLDLEEKESLPSKCVSVSFHRDRCDRSEIPGYSRQSNQTFKKPGFPQTPSSTSSPGPLRKQAPYYNTPQEEPHYQDSHAGCTAIPPAVDESSPLSPLSDHSGPENAFITGRDAPHSSEGVLLNARDVDTGSLTGDDEEEGKRKSKLGAGISSSVNSMESAGQESVIDSQPSSPANAPALLAPSNGRFYPVADFSDVHSIPSNFAYAPLSSTTSLPVNPMNPMNPMNPYQYNPDPFNVGNRTIFLGNLHPNTQVDEIANNVRAGGLVESIHFLKSKKMCFITFVDPAVALKFFLNHQVLHRLIIHGNDIKVSWGRNHSGPLNREIALAVTAGASRNVYIGIKPFKDSLVPKPVLPDEETLRADFSKFGDLEQVNFYHNKNCGFVNFMNIMSAIKLVELFESNNEQGVTAVAGDNGEFFRRYKAFKISFGKDRCGNPPKFSFKKKNAPVGAMKDSSEYFDNSRIERPRPPTNNSFINEEAAMVFGISTSPPKDLSDDSIIESELEFSQILDKDLERELPSNDTSELKPESPSEAKEQPLQRDGQEGDLSDGKEDEEEDDDDDISIIISSDATSLPQKTRTPTRSSKPPKFYNRRHGLSDYFGHHYYGSQNSSAISLESNYRKYPNYHNSYGSIAQPPFVRQQSRPGMSTRSSSFQGHAQMPGIAPQAPYLMQSMPPIIKHPSMLSGSQVMAQYLAKSQHDNFIYANSILANDVSPEEVREYQRHSKRNAKKNEA